MISAAQAQAFARDCDACPSLLPSDFGQAAARALESVDAPIASVYAELRLAGAPTAPADLLYAFDHVHASAVARQLSATGDSPGLARLSTRWSTPGDLIHAQVPVIWLEFDDLRAGGPARPPSVSVCLIPGYRRALAPSPTPDPARALALMVTTLDALRERACEPGEMESLAAVIRALGPGGRLIHLSVMLGREPRAIKLYARVPRAACEIFLTTIGWRGPGKEFAGLLDELAPPRHVGTELYLDLTLDELHAPGGGRLGVAFGQQQVAASEGQDPSRAALLAAARAYGLCTRDELAALSSWARTEQRTHAAGAWPSRIQRWLDLKLVWRADAAPALKAYLGWSARAASVFDAAG